MNGEGKKMRKRMKSLSEKKRVKHQKTVAKKQGGTMGREARLNPQSREYERVQKEKKVMNEDTPKVPANVPAETKIEREKETITSTDIGEMPAGVADDTESTPKKEDE